MGAVLTNDHVNDLARWAFGPGAEAKHKPHNERLYRCSIFLPPDQFSGPYDVRHFYGPTWADVFERAGWPFPPPPRKTYIALGQSILLANGDATEQVATARSITMATRIAKALNRS